SLRLSARRGGEAPPRPPTERGAVRGSQPEPGGRESRIRRSAEDRAPDRGGAADSFARASARRNSTRPRPAVRSQRALSPSSRDLHGNPGAPRPKPPPPAE